MQTEQIKLQTKDGKELLISQKAAELSELLKGIIVDYSNSTSIPINEVDSKIGEKVIEYLNHFDGTAPPEIEKPLPSVDLQSLIDEWSYNYLNKMSLDEMIDVSIAANFMGIQPLIDLCCAKLASMCKDQTEEQIFKNFGITEPFTEEEKQKVIQENPWIEENIQN